VKNSEAENTKRLTRISVNISREYLLSKQISAEFEDLACEELDRLLGSFYIEFRNNKGDMYKKNTLLSYRQGIQRFLQSIRPDVDIIKGPQFRESNKFFKGWTPDLHESILSAYINFTNYIEHTRFGIRLTAIFRGLKIVFIFEQKIGMTMELKRQGQANIDHHPPISDANLIKMYDYLSSSDSAPVLQQKVNFKNLIMANGYIIDQKLMGHLLILFLIYDRSLWTL
jgi:hypothetical protein